MSKILISSLALLIIVVACNKDKFQTKPTVEIKSIQPNVIAQGQNLSINLTFTDKQGDLGQGELVLIFNRINIRPVGSTGQFLDTLHLTLPDFPDRRKGDITFDALAWDEVSGSPVEPDSFYIKFAIVDKAGNKSDTVTSQLLISEQ